MENCGAGIVCVGPCCDAGRPQGPSVQVFVAMLWGSVALWLCGFVAVLCGSGAFCGDDAGSSSLFRSRPRGGIDVVRAFCGAVDTAGASLGG